MYWKFGIVLTVLVALNQSACAGNGDTLAAEGSEPAAGAVGSPLPGVPSLGSDPLANGGAGVGAAAPASVVKCSQADIALVQLNIGWALENGLGVERDFVQAAWWYQEAGINGNPGAYFYLACLLAEGRVASEDPSLTIAVLYEKAASRGCAEAQFNLGLAYGKGREGVAQDYSMALKCFYAVISNPTAKEEMRAQARIGIKWAKQRQKAAAAAMAAASTPKLDLIIEEKDGEGKE
jgi:TPR repeat protein